jgi:hypothetical protein
MKLETKSLIFNKPQSDSICYDSICDSTVVTVALFIIRVTRIWLMTSQTLNFIP